MKKWLAGAIKSWTIWFNSVVLALVPIIDILKDSLPQLQEYIDATTYKLIGLAVLLVNIGLRIKTTKSLAEK